MKRNQLVFFLIIGGALLIVGIGFGIQALSSVSDVINEDPPTAVPTAAEPLRFSVAVNPLIEPWISDAADAFNAQANEISGRIITVTVERQDSIEVWSEGNNIWSSADHPLVWIPEATYSLQYGDDINLRYTSNISSLAQTPIIWGVYESRAFVLENQYGSINADSVQQAAVAERWEDIGGNTRWQFVKLAFARPNSTSGGLASLFSLVSAYQDDPSIDGSAINDANLQAWLMPLIDAVPNFSTLGIDPALVMGTRGTSTADLGLLPESQWLIDLASLDRNEPIQLYYPEVYVLLDFPYTIWEGSETSDEERRAAETFGEFLMSDEQQFAAGDAGFRPATANDLAQFSPFNAAGDRLQPDLTGTIITPPDRPAVLSLLRWFSNYRTAP